VACAGKSARRPFLPPAGYAARPILLSAPLHVGNGSMRARGGVQRSAAAAGRQTQQFEPPCSPPQDEVRRKAEGRLYARTRPSTSSPRRRCRHARTTPSAQRRLAFFAAATFAAFHVPPKPHVEQEHRRRLRKKEQGESAPQVRAQKKICQRAAGQMFSFRRTCRAAANGDAVGNSSRTRQAGALRYTTAKSIAQR